MKKQEHRVGVSAVNLVVRHLKLEAVAQDLVAAATEEIDKVYGLDGVSFDEKTQVLNLAYDGSKVSIDGIEELLRKHGINVSHDWWTHFKESYYRFIDDNVKDNARHEPLSCHKVPLGAGRKP